MAMRRCAVLLGVLLAGVLLTWGDGFRSRAADSSAPVPASGRRSLVVLGDSLAAGYGVEPEQAFPSWLQRWIEASKFDVEVTNAGVSGDTTAGGLRRLNWLLRRPIDVLVVELGGNDGLRGLPLDATRSNLTALVQRTREKFPAAKVVLAGMQMPPNLGEDYTTSFRELYPRLAKELDLVLVPHLLEGVGGRPEFNQPDQIHPTPEGHRMVATNVWKVLEPVLRLVK